MDSIKVDRSVFGDRGQAYFKVLDQHASGDLMDRPGNHSGDLQAIRSQVDEYCPNPASVWSPPTRRQMQSATQ